MSKRLLGTALLIACASAALTAQASDGTLENTTIGGKLFIDFTRIDFKNDGVEQPANGVGIDVKRGYLVVAHTFDDMWSANITTDFNYSSSDAETQLFVKKAYLQAKLSDVFFARVGSADLAWVPFVEEAYGYRFVEKLLIDRVGYGTTADWGLHVGGKFADGMVNYAVSGVNGNGYKNPIRSNGVDIEGRVGVVPVKGLTLALGFYNGKLGLDTEGLAPANQPRSAERWDAFAGYVRSEFRVGVEYFEAKDWKVLNSAASDKATGYSVWGAYTITPQFSAFARYDQTKPKKETNPALKDTYFNVGAAYKPRKNIDLALAYKEDKVENGSFKSADATIGTASGLEGKYDEVGVWMQVSF